VQDPRITVFGPALAAQFHLQQRMVSGLGVTYQAMRYIQELREAMTARTKAAGGADLAAAAQAVDSALIPLTSGPTGFGIAHRDLGRRLNDQLVADMELTPSVIAGVDQPCAAIDHQIEELRRIQGSSLAALEAAVAKAGLPRLPSWSPPAAPSCGR
jgi:hypothetical protein